MPGKPFLPMRRLLERGHEVDPLAKRVTQLRAGTSARGDFVLYWAQSARRLRNNPALEYAITEANRRRLPVVVYESIRPDYPSANDRMHTFVLEGVARNERDAAERGLRYVFFLPRTREEARGVLAGLSSRAALVVTDEYPAFIFTQQTRRLAANIQSSLVLVDGNGVLPMRAFAKEQYSAKQLRDRAHVMLPQFWGLSSETVPAMSRFEGAIDLPEWKGDPRAASADCEIDHSVPPVATIGGREAGLAQLDGFVSQRLAGYAESRNANASATSGLSPYLHFGHLGAEEVARRVILSEAPAEDIDAFLEELIIRRELSFNLCFFRADHGSLTALPEWATRTLDRHRGDRRRPLYDEAELEHAATGDDVWNLSQRALLATGTMFGYIRMLWGKKIIEWSETPEAAHATMLRMHERYAIDGRDPNTHAGVLWCFGKHDRPWGERPIFGTVRYMSSDSTARKVKLAEYEKFVVERENGLSSNALDPEVVK